MILKFSNQIASTTRDPHSAALRDLTAISANLASVRQKIDIGEMADLQSTLRDLNSIESELEEWISNISPSCHYDSVSTPTSFQISPRHTLRPYRSYSYKYSKFWVANMWNEYRITKFQISDMILTHLRPQATLTDDSPGYKDARAQCLRARSQMAQISEDICCSVPYILGLLNQEHRDSPHLEPAVRDSHGAFVLLWPLTVAALAQLYPSPTSDFVFDCLDLISNVMGIQQATAFRNLVISSSAQYTWVGNI